MTKHSFELQPFQEHFHGIKLSGNCERHGQYLRICYEWLDPQEAIHWPNECYLQQIQDNLWRQTCCELFVASGDARNYWEFNYSPAGHWNCYRYDDYRKGSQSQVRKLPTVIQANIQNTYAKLDIETQLPAPIQHADLYVNICAVVQTGKKPLHFALKHSANKPDFHRREGFVLFMPK